MSDNLRSKIVRLAHSRPDLRPHLLPILAAGPDIEDMRLRLEAILDEQERLVEESRAFGVRLAAAARAPAGTMPFAKMVKIREGFQENTEELERYIREFTLSRTPAHLQNDAKALLKKAQANLAKFKAQRDKAEEAFVIYVKTYQAEDIAELMDTVEKFVRSRVKSSVKVERKVRYELNTKQKGVVISKLHLTVPTYWTRGYELRIVGGAGFQYGVSLWNSVDGTLLNVEFQKSGRNRVVPTAIGSLRDGGLFAEDEPKSDLLPTLKKEMSALEKGIMSKMTGKAPYSKTDKPHEAFDPKGNLGVESSFSVEAGYEFQVTLLVSSEGTWGQVRARYPSRLHSQAGPWKTFSDFRLTTIRSLVDTVTDHIIEQDTKEGLGLVKYEPTKGTVDIEALRRYYSSNKIKNRSIIMSESGAVNPSSALVGIKGPVTFAGYAFYGAGHSYSGLVDGFYGELKQTPKGWVFDPKEGPAEPVGSNADVIKLVTRAYKALDEQIDSHRMRD
jgi:hypothetical protein